MQPVSRLKDFYLLFSSPEHALVNISEPGSLTAEDRIIAAHVEALGLAHVEAINTRDLDLTSPAWSNLSSNFIGDVRGVCMKTPRRMDRHDYIDSYKLLVQISPEYHLEVIDVSTQVTLQSKAIVTMKIRNTGNPPGVARRIMIVEEWRSEGLEGEWQCTDLKAVRGVDEFEAES